MCSMIPWNRNHWAMFDSLFSLWIIEELTEVWGRISTAVPFAVYADEASGNVVFERRHHAMYMSPMAVLVLPSATVLPSNGLGRNSSEEMFQRLQLCSHSWEHKVSMNRKKKKIHGNRYVLGIKEHVKMNPPHSPRCSANTDASKPTFPLYK